MLEPNLLQCLSIRIKITDTHPITNQNINNYCRKEINLLEIKSMHIKMQTLVLVPKWLFQKKTYFNKLILS